MVLGVAVAMGCGVTPPLMPFPPDAGYDAGSDTGVNMVVDAGGTSDVPPLSSPDTNNTDTGADVPVVDIGTDTSTNPDVPVLVQDAGNDAGSDGSSDGGSNMDVEGPGTPDVGVDAPIVHDTPSEASTEAATGQDAGADVATDVPAVDLGPPDVGTPDVGCIIIDTSSDPMNCGACGHVCPGGANVEFAGCSMGQCYQRCSPHFGNCNEMASDGCEINTLNNNANCGHCDNICETPGVCSMGRCLF